MNGVDSAAVDMPDAVSIEHSDAIKPKIRCVIIDCSSMMFIDTVGTTTIQQVLTVADTQCPEKKRPKYFL